MRPAKRILGETLVLATAIALAAGIANLVGPRSFPEPGRQFSGIQKTQFYKRLILGQTAFLVAGIVFYVLLHKLYDRWRARNSAPGSAGPNKPPSERTDR
jgi:hypothetical protein